jgi:hypothetical protein
MEADLFPVIWIQLVWPLVRILLLVSFGLVVANFIESLNWTHRLALLARPLVRFGRLSHITGASFTMAFFSGVSANTMLSEAFDKGQIDKKELVLANLFNSLPRFFLHLPTVFFLTVPLIKGAAFIYVGLTFSAAMMQTLLVVLCGRFMLLEPEEKMHTYKANHRKISWKQALEKSIKRFRKRIPKIIYFMVPVYVLFFFLSHYGFFEVVEDYVARKAWFLSWLDPKALGIVLLHITTEFSAGLAAAGAMLADNSLGYKEVVLALLAGNVLAAPIRAVRHQVPYYVGIFPPKIALELVGISQMFRLACIMVIGCCYYFWQVS